MQFGLFLSLQHPVERDPYELLDQRLEQVRTARELGFDSVFAGHHYLVPPAYQVFQTVPMIARLAAEAGEMTVGAGVLLASLLNPVDLAEQAATLQVICGGRFVLGVGRGYRQEEYDAFGVERPGAAFAAKVEVARRLLDGETVTAFGPGYRLENATLALQQGRRPPIWVAATTEATVRRAAALGDAWVISTATPPTEIERLLGIYTEARGGVAPDVVAAIRDVAVAETDDEAMIAAEPLFNPRGTSAVHGADESRFVVGGPETAARRLGELERAGVTHVLFRVQRVGVTHEQALRSLEVLARGVRPLLEGAAV